MVIEDNLYKGEKMETFKPFEMVRGYLNLQREAFEDSFIPLVKIEELFVETTEKIYRNSNISNEGEKKLEEWRIIFCNYQNIRSSFVACNNNLYGWLFYLNS